MYICGHVGAAARRQASVTRARRKALEASPLMRRAPRLARATAAGPERVLVSSTETILCASAVSLSDVCVWLWTDSDPPMYTLQRLSAALSAGRGAGVGCESESLCWSPSACVARFGDVRASGSTSSRYSAYVSHRYLAGRGGDGHGGRGAVYRLSTCYCSCGVGAVTADARDVCTCVPRESAVSSVRCARKQIQERDHLHLRR